MDTAEYDAETPWKPSHATGFTYSSCPNGIWKEYLTVKIVKHDTPQRPRILASAAKGLPHCIAASHTENASVD